MHDAVKSAAKKMYYCWYDIADLGSRNDLVIAIKSEKAITEAFEIINDYEKKVGLVVNEIKTKYLKLASAASIWSCNDIKLKNFGFKNVSTFVYLGYALNNFTSHKCFYSNNSICSCKLQLLSL